MMDNTQLKETYESMHAQGKSAWFDSGWEERKTIINMGEPWTGLNVLEIGCGEGDLCAMMTIAGADVYGMDYSEEAIKKANDNYSNLRCFNQNYKQRYIANHERIVLQGVLEHLDNPFKELKWMIDNLLKPGGDVITSSPCFLNPRGIIWMTLNMLGAVMSKTDLHYLNPWEFGDFCLKYKYKMTFKDCNRSWGMGNDMLKDLEQRIPLALKDGNLPYDQERFNEFMTWLFDEVHQATYNQKKGKETFSILSILSNCGAVVVYRIQT